jgi:hypothetical protein
VTRRLARVPLQSDHHWPVTTWRGPPSARRSIPRNSASNLRNNWIQQARLPGSSLWGRCFRPASSLTPIETIFEGQPARRGANMRHFAPASSSVTACGCGRHQVWSRGRHQAQQPEQHVCAASSQRRDAPNPAALRDADHCVGQRNPPPAAPRARWRSPHSRRDFSNHPYRSCRSRLGDAVQDRRGGAAGN